MARSAERLVGRADEVGALERVLDQLDLGNPAWIEVTGEPGIGKTRLLAEMAARAEERGHVALSGAGSELQRDYPFSVFVDALDDYLGSLDSRRLAGLSRQVRTEIADVFPSLSSLAATESVALQHERHKSQRAVRELLERVTAPTPLVLILDDIHWADAASIELLDSLLRHPPSAPVAVALAARPRQLPERLVVALERARRDDRLVRLELRSLSQAEASELLAGLPAAAAASLYDESGGNPFYLGQLARALMLVRETGSDIDDLSAAIGVPPPVAAALREELGLLVEGERTLLQGAAVCGDPFEPELAAAAAATSEAAALDAIDDLVERDLIRETDVPRRFRFRHPLLRRAVYETAGRGWRLGAHERCAAALEARGASVTARAYHVERSARAGDANAVALLRDAGKATSRLAPASAANWFTSALRLLSANAPAGERAELLLARAQCLASIGRLTDSRADLLACLDILPADAIDRRLRATTACVAVEQQLGLHGEAHRHLVAALAAVGAGNSAEAVELMVELTLDEFHAGRLAAMVGWTEQAVTAARQLNDQALLGLALSAQAWAASFAGEPGVAQERCDEAADVVDGLSDVQVADHIDALAHLAAADVYLDRFAGATRHAQRGFDIARATGQSEVLPLLVAMLGGSMWVQGRAIEAADLLDDAVEAARLTGNAQNVGWALFNDSIAAFAAGNLDVALATARESVDLATKMESGALAALSGAVLAYVLFETGRAAESVDALLSSSGGTGLPLIGGAWRARFLELLTRAQLATGRRAEAEAAAEATRASADTTTLPTARAMASLADADLALDAGDAAAAADHALAAAGVFESVNALWDAARARAFAGRAFIAAGESVSGTRELELAAAAFDSFGATRYRDQAERELRKLGHHLHRRSRAGNGDGWGLGSLTERELEVAHLVVDRRTNREIAAELFLSEKTVEAHLRNIFNKVGVERRRDLAVVLTQPPRRSAVLTG